MIYSGGIPLLYPISALYFLVTYWVDKWMLIKFNRKPPNFSTRMAKGVLYWFKWALLIHFIVSYYMYSKTTILGMDPFQMTLCEWRDRYFKHPKYAYDIAIFVVFGTYVFYRFVLRYCFKYFKTKWGCCRSSELQDEEIK